MPLYLRLPAYVTYTQAAEDRALWRQLMRTCDLLEAYGWVTRLMPQWRAIDPEARLEGWPLDI